MLIGFKPPIFIIDPSLCNFHKIRGEFSFSSKLQIVKALFGSLTWTYYGEYFVELYCQSLITLLWI